MAAPGMDGRATVRGSGIGIRLRTGTAPGWLPGPCRAGPRTREPRPAGLPAAAAR
jgi:hypothetical protein